MRILAAKWHYLELAAGEDHPWLRGPLGKQKAKKKSAADERRSMWLAENRRLAGIAIAGGPAADDALLDLIRRDPRYVSSELVFVRMIGWQLDVLLGNRRTLESNKDRDRRTDRKSIAEKSLVRMGNALKASSGKGNREWRDPSEILSAARQLESVATEISRLITGRRSARLTKVQIATLAQRSYVEDTVIEELLKEAKPGVAGLVVALLAKRYAVSPDRMGRILSSAKRTSLDES